MKTKIYPKKTIYFLLIWIWASLSISLALGYFNSYIPPAPPSRSPTLPPPPKSAIRYAPQKSTIFPPPPGGWYGASQKPSGPPFQSSPPTPPIDPNIKDFPIDLDLTEFSERNPYPKEHCFFPVKGRKDIVEYFPIGSEEDSEEFYGVWNFPTGTCNLEANQCSYGKRVKVRNLFNNKIQKPPVIFIYDKLIQSHYGRFPVIPYTDVENIDFTQCMPTWNGYMEIDDLKVYEYESPKRDYSKQSCYHPFHADYMGSVFCDSKKCQLTENQYCTEKNGQCYLNDYPLKTRGGKSVTTMENFVFLNWDFCTDSSGALIPKDGGPPYEERFKAGCSYRIEAPNFHEKQYAGKIDFLIKCDENRCMGGGLEFDMKRKEYVSHYINEETRYSKTPPLEEFYTINWTCLDATKVRDYNKKLLCTYAITSEKAPDCQLCYENKKFVYKNCGQ